MFIRAGRDGKRVTLPEELRKRLAEGEGPSRVWGKLLPISVKFFS
jgi:hypothetical protein